MSLCVMSYNILLGGESRMPLIQDVIKGQNPDVVALLEANSRANAEKLAQELDMQLTFGEGNSEFHIAWLSRFPVVRAQVYRPAVLQKLMLEIEVNWQGAPLYLFATHLSAGRSQPGDKRRLQEIEAILDILRQVKGKPNLLVGDFNAIAPSDTVGPGPDIIKDDAPPDIAFSREVINLVLGQGYTDCYRAMHPTMPGYTYKLPRPPWLRLDYIFASPEMAPLLYASDIVSSEEAYKASDHLPVWAEFR
jgi:exodeoxyribonuclease III